MNKTTNTKIIWVIIASWEPQNKLFPWVYDPLIPINWKPTINYIINFFEKNNIDKIIVLINKKDIDSHEYINFLKSSLDIEIINIENSNSLWETLSYLKHSKFIIDENTSLLLNLWDTIYNGDFNINENNILISNKIVFNPLKWSYIDKNWNILNNIDWEKNIICWLFFIKNWNRFLNTLINKKDFYLSLSNIIKKEWYITTLENNNWYDLWHIDQYYKSKIDFLRVRSFNSLKYDDFRWIITKKSSKKEKIQWEINWFNNLPNDLKIFTPRLVDFDFNNWSYSLEFYWYPSMWDIYLYWNYNNVYINNFISKILNFIDYSKKNFNDKNFPYKNLYDIYINKTFSRINEIKENKIIFEIFNKEKVNINWVEYNWISNIFKNNSILVNILDKYINKIEDFSIIHWDLCFSNILIDPYNWLIKLIDPRWNFWDIWIWWDIKYDIAKLRHSINWWYEYIISDLFKISEKENNFEYIFFNWDKNKEKIIEMFDKNLISNWYNIDLIKFIEWLLYLTMIPLHKDSLDRQKVMLLNSIKLINESYKNLT